MIHLLQHPAGFDDMQFTEMDNVEDEPDVPLIDALRHNPRSRDVRWRPGTRVSYSNPGYAVAGYLVENITSWPYEDLIAERTFAPLGMTTSSVRLTLEDEALLAKGFRARTGPPVGYGSATSASTTEGFPMLGHRCGIDSFSSLYADAADLATCRALPQGRCGAAI